MGERRGTKALELWCRRITDGYPGVNVQNMTTSWRDGLAFCAMIHHFRPDLIDFDSLNKNDVYGNNELAFRTAEQHLGIPALLDAEDMASCTVPDRLSILTYLSQFYQTFGGSSPNRLATNRTNSESSDERIAPVPESPKQKVGSRLGMRRDPCVACGMPVFLAEKLLIARAPYHRTCFRCARCNNQLTPGNYYETEEGQYCCETCPDEEETVDVRHKYTEPAAMSGAEQEENELPRPLSDEEKERKGARNLLESTAVPDVISHTLQMRKNFMANHLLSEKVEDSTVAKDMSASTNDLEVNSDYPEETKSRIGSAFPDDDENEEDEEEEEEEEEDEEEEESRSSATDSPEVESNIEQQFDVHSALNSLNIKSDENQRSTAISLHDVDKRKEENTKELPENNERANPEIKLSLVQKRLQMFESRDKIEHIDRKNQNKRGIPVQDITVDKNDSQDLASQDVLQVNKKERSEKKLEEDLMMIKNTDNRKNSIESVSKQLTVENTLKITDIEKREESTKDTEDYTNIAQSEESSDITNSGKANFLKFEEKFKKDSENLCEVATGNSVLTAKPIDLSGNEDYPEDLNPFKSDEEDSVTDNTPLNIINSSTISKVSTNPFDSEDEDIEESKPPKPAARSKSENRRVLAEMSKTNRVPFGSQSNIDSSWCDKKDSSIRSNPHTVINSSKDSKVSTNPFDSEDEDIEEPEPPKPAARSKPEDRGIATSGTKRVLAAPQINLDSFWSDEEEEHSDEAGEQNRTPQGNVPVPKPRTIKITPETSTVSRRADLNRGSVYASNSSLASFESTTTPGGTYRKKRPAPQPPAAKELFPSDQRESPNKSCNTSLTSDQTSSPRTTLRPRKSKPAPPPPVISSTPCNVSTDSTNLNFDVSPIIKLRGTKDDHDQNIWEDQKTNKDEANRNRQSLSGNSCDDSLKSYSDKSVQGKWKRKKGPAPPRPIPHRRKIKVLSMKDVKLELDEIELQQQGLERQGVRLEQMIRDKCESGSRIEDPLSTDVEELVLELFALVNEKNELFRRQAELILLRRQQRLEEEHAEVEYQIRCLMCQPEATKTDFDKQREETLIQRLVQIVERRNEIVECLETDRRREVEEDKSINKYMGLFAARNKNKQSDKNNDSSSTGKTKKGKVKEKVKEKKSKKTTKKDADKDVDETEMKLKRHNKRKWF